jgi:hypothetical protein
VAEVFGDTADFAVEAGVEPDLHTEATVRGHMCVWCRGVPLGERGERYCGLYPAYRKFAWLADNLGRLWAAELEGLDDVSAWNVLDGLLYGCAGPRPPLRRPDHVSPPADPRCPSHRLNATDSVRSRMRAG